jgi:hypothetical protein
MTSPEPAPPADPTSYRRRASGLGPWAVVSLCLLCVLAGALVMQLAPSLIPDKPRQTESHASNPLTAWLTPSPESGAAPEPPTAPVIQPAPAPAVGGDLTGVRSRLDRLEQSQARTAEAAATALATAALLEASQTSRRFDGELAQVEALLLDSPDVAALRSLSRTGAPTRQMLAGEFADAATSAVADANKPGPDSGIMQRVRYAVSSIVTIRRVGSVQGKSADAILARAEVHAAAGEVEMALGELATLPAPAQSQPKMREWIERASRRAEVDRRIAAIRAASLRAVNQVLAGAG